MWVVIVIVAFILFKFLSDRSKQATAVAKQGGMRKKYSVLIDYILSGHQNCKIHQEESTFIRVGSVSPGGSTFFDIMQTFGTVTIQWKSKSALFGNHELEWEFNEFLSQYSMIEKINADIEAYMTNVINKYQ